VERLLGGSASPIGWSVQFLAAPRDAVVAAVLDVRRGSDVRTRTALRYPDSLAALLPFEAPWTRELLHPCGGWTAYLNNGVNGGDSTAIGPAVAREMNVRCVVADHSPKYGPGHQGTQLEVFGPGGTPPLMCERALSATATDGRWEWHDGGAALPFEDTDRYIARRIRDRFDRALLVKYLLALGIRVDDDDAYGDGLLVQQVVDWPRRTVSLTEAQADIA
jgi:hypothetical protein